MKLEIEDRAGVRIFEASGELDTFAAQSFRESLGLIRASDRYVVNLSRVSFVDSAGLHALFGVVRVAKEVGAAVAFVVPDKSPVRRVVDLIQLADVSPVCDSVEVAIARVTEPSASEGFDDGKAG